MTDSPHLKCDLLIKGGRVIDPANGIDDFLDVAISGHVISAVARDIPESSAARVAHVPSWLVTPGLVDLHAHFFGYFGAVFPDETCLPTGVTTALDAGGSGHLTFDTFNREVIQRSAVRVFALLNIAGEGMVGDPEQDVEGMDVSAAAAKIEQRADIIVGLKVAHFRGPGWQPLDHAVEAARATGTFVMVDQTPIASRPMDQMMLEHMRPGDIVTHCYADSKPMVGASGQVKSYFREARERGIHFDVGHGAGSFSWKIASTAFDQGFPPDTISTDLHRSSILASNATMPETMSKMLECGMDLADVIRASTREPALKLGHPELGTLSQGAVADVTVLEMQEGQFGLTDNGTTGQRVRQASRRLIAQMTICGGTVKWDLSGVSKEDWSNTPAPYEVPEEE
ncbi:MAG: amidohydrolase/deacetylase family metallohydrolase [Dehalococcoidia bacterium]